MLKLYIKLVKVGEKTIDSIPPEYREKVRATLEAEGIIVE